MTKKEITEVKASPTIVLGDVHGLTHWKKAITDNPECRYIFLGDYLDPYEVISHKQLINNLKEIIQLKKNLYDNVVLLLGNHDIHYLFLDILPCWRFDETIKQEAHTLFSENFNLFSFAFQENNLIFTHAGISQRWFVDEFRGDTNKNIAEQLNNPTRDQRPVLYGSHGIFWVRPRDLNDPLPYYRQFVGHNRVDEIRKHPPVNNGEITFCDCLYNGKYLKL